MAKEHLAYLSYLLRLWRVENHGEVPGAGEAIWRASLESARTGEKRTFASLDDLLDFLREQTGRFPSRPIQQDDSKHTD
jgi:hypothetical protein